MGGEATLTLPQVLSQDSVEEVVYLKLNKKDSGQLKVRYGFVQSAHGDTPLQKRHCPGTTDEDLPSNRLCEKDEDLPIPQSIDTPLSAVHRTDSSESFESIPEEQVFSQQQAGTLHLDDDKKQCDDQVSQQQNSTI